jgi:hypothetical protein
LVRILPALRFEIGVLNEAALKALIREAVTFNEA